MHIEGVAADDEQEGNLRAQGRFGRIRKLPSGRAPAGCIKHNIDAAWLVGAQSPNYDYEPEPPDPARVRHHHRY